MGRLRFLLIALSALALTACSITMTNTASSTVTKDAHKVAELDVLYFAHDRLRVNIQRYSSLYFASYRLMNGSLTIGAGKIVTAFGNELVGTFDEAARTSGVLRRLTVSDKAPVNAKAIEDALPDFRFVHDDALVIAPALVDVVCGDNRCSFAVSFRAVLYDAKAKKVMWHGTQQLSVIRTLKISEAEMFEFDAVEAVESYWNEIFGTLRSDRLLERDVKVKLRTDAAPSKANPS